MNAKIKLLKSIEKNELINYLEGVGEYKIELHQWVGAYVPTDVSQVLSKGVYEVYIDVPELNIDKMLENALLEMMDREVFDLYCALSLIFVQLLREHRNGAPFRLDMEKVLEQLRESLLKNKEKLKNYFEWEGKGKKNGMWSEVLRIDRICKEDWNLSII